jgi:acetoacetate decarboxylase
MALKHDEGWNIPPDAPYYPSLPAYYRNVKFHYLFFTADPKAVHSFLPEPLEASPDGSCVAGGLDAPFSSNYGPFQASWIVMKCIFRGQSGYYCSHVFYSGTAGLAAGREIYGTPKISAQMSVRQVERSMISEASMGGVPVFRLSTSTPQVVPKDSMPDTSPAWQLKIIPRADGPGPAIKQLIDTTNVPRDAVVHYLARGEGKLALTASPIADLSSLQPISYGDAYYMESDYSEHYAKIVYDYLEKKSKS